MGTLLSSYFAANYTSITEHTVKWRKQEKRPIDLSEAKQSASPGIATAFERSG